MDELVGVAVKAGIAFVVRKATRMGLATLKARGVEVPVWMDRVVTPLAGIVAAGVDETFDVSEMLHASAGGDALAEPGSVAAGPAPGLEQDRPPHGGTLPTAGP